MDELNSLPYLENVIRETMRVHAPFMFTQLMAMEDDVLPLSKPYADRGKIARQSTGFPQLIYGAANLSSASPKGR